jgi:hypothetical protein
MFHLARGTALTIAALLVATAVPAAAGQQPERRPPPAREPQRHPPSAPERGAQPRSSPDRSAQPRPSPDRRRDRVPAVRSRIFVRGHFYDPYAWSYPWWPYGAYPYWYSPIYDQRAWLQIKATPKDAGVYVDGYYAGIVDEFDSAFQGLPLPAGGYHVVLYREGYRPSAHDIYLRRGATFTLRDALRRLPPGEHQEPPPGPERAPAITERRLPATTAFLDVRVTPADASIVIDGRSWVSDGGQVFVALPPGTHLIRVFAPGYASFAVELPLEAGHTAPIDVKLVPSTN